MSLANTKLNTSAKQGFTIVELLIVVVVIAILAVITIVSFNGITNRANASAAKSTAATWQKKIELYQAEVGAYPFAVTSMDSSAKSYHMERSGVATSLTSETGKNRVIISPCGTALPTSDATTTGVRIQFWDYEASPNGVTSTPVIVGSCPSGSVFAPAWTPAP